MRAAMLTDIRQIEVREHPEPVLEKSTDVLLRMHTVGVCGSDVHYYTTGRIGSQVVQFPFPVGHEASAIVEDVGGDVTTVKPGDRVAVEPAVSCFQCDQCRAGRPHTCRHLKFLGCPGQLEGCLKDYIVMPADCCYPIPDHMSMEAAALSEPLSIGVYAAWLAGLRSADNIAIFGAGPIGLSVQLAARAQGVESIYVADPLDYRLRTAQEQGASWGGDPSEENIVETICDREPLGMDVVFECCGQQDAVDQAVELLRPGGKLMIVGIPEFDRYAFRADIARRHELCLQNVRRQNQCVQKALDLIANGQADPGFMATHRFGLDQVKEAFDLVDNYADGVVKAMIQIA